MEKTKKKPVVIVWLIMKLMFSVNFQIIQIHMEQKMKVSP